MMVRELSWTWMGPTLTSDDDDLELGGVGFRHTRMQKGVMKATLCN